MRFLILCAALALFYYISGVIIAEESDTRGAVYCAHVEAYKETGGRYGWPPYRGDCPPVAR